jgi:phage terminase large subunit-like protein
MGEGKEGAQHLTWSADNSSLIEYKERIDAGEIIAGMELRMELDNLVSDIRENGDYIYNTDAALLRMDFMENCIRLTKSPFYGKPMVLMLWQKAFIEALYSFKMAREWKEGREIDRFKKSLLLIARKNAKSETCSGMGNAEFIVGNEGADIVCSSNDDAQASIVYDAMNTMRQLYDPDDLDTKRNQRFILNKSTNTKIFKLSDRTRNKEGRNIDWAILDEAHEMATNDIAKSIEQSQSTKENPKFIIITTEGFVVDGYLDKELKLARAIIKGEDDSVSASRYLPWLYTQDSETEIFTNKKSWMKSNPSLGVIKKWDYLEEQIDLAKKSKADRIFVLSKDFNMKQNAVESWLNIEDYAYSATYNLEDLRGCFCLGHVDLAETTDLCCAKALCILPGKKERFIITQYFIPQTKLEPDNDDHNAGAHYKEWAKAGYITICEGNDIDLTVVADWFYKLRKEHGITLYKCGYDQRFAKDWLRRMEDYGWSKQYEDVEMILQNAQTLNNARLLVEADLKAKLINYNENPVDRWCFKNACLKVDDLRQGLVVKTENAKKIDGAVTLVSLYELFRRYRSDFQKIAEKRRK